MRTALIIACLFIAEPAYAQTIAERLAALEAKTKKASAYEQAYEKARTEKKWLVVYVGINQRSIVGTVPLSLDEFNGSRESRIIFTYPGSGKGYAYPAETTDAELRALTGGEPVARPFRNTFLRPGEVTADGEVPPQLRNLISELEPYSTATMTQFTTRRLTGGLGPVSRSRLELKWIAPGNLSGIQGWASTLYRAKGIRASVFLVRQDPNDSVSQVTWSRSYPDGATFADVLRNDQGKVFEVRVAQKHDGQWDRFVAYRNPSARPHGYNPPKTADCRSCHEQAGRSEYNDAAIPGGDTIISDPYPDLEAGRYVSGGYGTRL